MFYKRALPYLFILFLSVMIGGCATVPRQPVSVQKETYLKDICRRNNINWQWDQVSQVVTLQYRGAKAKVLVGSDLVMVEKERVILSAPVRTVKSAVIVPRDFQTKVISRLRQEAGKKKENGRYKRKGPGITA